MQNGHNRLIPLDEIPARDGEVGRFVRLHDGTPLQEGERLLRYHAAGWRVQIMPDSCLFQEGHRPFYERAKYGVFKFNGADELVLAGLANADMQAIRPPVTPATEASPLTR